MMKPHPQKSSTTDTSTGLIPALQPARPGRRPLLPGSMHLVIKCMGLTKTFRDFWRRHRVCAVDRIDLEVRRGEVLGLLGPNGSGKTTTIKMILGLLHPTAGRVSVLGKQADDVAVKKLIGYLPEESYLYGFLNARETLDYFGRLFALSRQHRQRRIDMLLEMVGLEAVQRRPVGEYSTGMQRRIGLAQALINDPQLLILDEPTAGLDPIGTRQIKDLILELARRGKTILLCSHLLADVEDVCDRVAIMFGGRIRATGRVDEMLVQQDQTTIHTPRLNEAQIQKVESTLQSLGTHIDKVDHPRQKLEAHFLEVVQQAQAEGLATSGAQAGGGIPGFLVTSSPVRPDHEAENDDLDLQDSVFGQITDALYPTAEAEAEVDLSDATGEFPADPSSDTALSTVDTGSTTQAPEPQSSSFDPESDSDEGQDEPFVIGLTHEAQGDTQADAQDPAVDASVIDSLLPVEIDEDQSDTDLNAATSPATSAQGEPRAEADGPSAAEDDEPDGSAQVPLDLLVPDLHTPAEVEADRAHREDDGSWEGAGDHEQPFTMFAHALDEVPPYEEKEEDDGEAKGDDRDHKHKAVD